MHLREMDPVGIDATGMSSIGTDPLIIHPMKVNPIGLGGGWRIPTWQGVGGDFGAGVGEIAGFQLKNKGGGSSCAGVPSCTRRRSLKMDEFWGETTRFIHGNDVNGPWDGTESENHFSWERPSVSSNSTQNWH